MRDLEKEIKSEHEYIALKVKQAEARGFQKAVELLRSEEASRYSWDRYNNGSKCSKNDAHIPRGEWAAWLEQNNPYKEGK